MKLRPFTIIMFGIAIALIALSFGYFHYYSYNVTMAQNYRDLDEQNQLEINKMNKAIDKQKKAIEMADQQKAIWRDIVDKRTPPMSVEEGGINLAAHPFELVLDVKTYRNSLQRAINDQLKVGGVTVLQAPEIPYPNSNPNTILADFFNYPQPVNFPVIVYDLGQIRVEGTYEQIMENVRAYSRMPNYLAVADGLSLSGTGETLTGTYNLSIVGFIRAPVVHPPVTGVNISGAAQQQGGAANRFGGGAAGRLGGVDPRLLGLRQGGIQ